LTAIKGGEAQGCYIASQRLTMNLVWSKYRRSAIYKGDGAMLDARDLTLTPAARGPIDTDAAAAVARALAHPARVRIIALLLSRPGCIGGDIVGAVNLAQSTVSEHLRILKAAGVVTGEIERPRVCYSLNPAALAPLAGLLAAVAARPGGGAEICCSPDGGASPKKTCT